MSNEAIKTPATKPAPKLDEAIRVKMLLFKSGADLPNEQQISRLQAMPHERSDKPRYEIFYVPRAGMYFVREYAPRIRGVKNDELVLKEEFLVPREWAVPVLVPS